MGITISVSEETWKRLKNLKSRPSQTFDEIIWEALEDAKMRR